MAEMLESDHPDAVIRARIFSGGRTWQLGESQSLDFGRESEVPMGAEPIDLEIARRAGTLSFHEGSVWVRSQSANTIFLRRESGPDIVIDQAGMVVAPSGPRFTVLLKGSVMNAYTIDVVLPQQQSGPERPVEGPNRTRNVRDYLTSQEIRRLAALCYLLFKRAGPLARPATWAEAGQMLGVDGNTVRKYVAELRRRLAVELGVPDLIEDYNPADPDSPKPKDELAFYAWRNRVVHEGDLEMLKAPEADR